MATEGIIDVKSLDERKFHVDEIRPAVRWIMRDGALVLQQWWAITEYIGNRVDRLRGEWRDVPIEDETVVRVIPVIPAEDHLR